MFAAPIKGSLRRAPPASDWSRQAQLFAMEAFAIYRSKVMNSRYDF